MYQHPNSILGGALSGASAAAAPQDVRPIENEIRELNHQLHILAASICSLQERIAPCLLQERPSTTCENAAAGKEKSQLAIAIESQTDIARQCRYRIESMLDRCQM